jgi:hypothetical protein
MLEAEIVTRGEERWAKRMQANGLRVPSEMKVKILSDRMNRRLRQQSRDHRRRESLNKGTGCCCKSLLQSIFFFFFSGTEQADFPFRHKGSGQFFESSSRFSPAADVPAFHYLCFLFVKQSGRDVIPNKMERDSGRMRDESLPCFFHPSLSVSQSICRHECRHSFLEMQSHAIRVRLCLPVSCEEGEVNRDTG